MQFRQGGIHNQWPTSSTLLFSLPELATLRHSHACHHLGSLPDCSRCCPHYIQVLPISKPYLSHSPLALPLVLSSNLCTSCHHPSRAPFMSILALLQWIILLSAFIQPGLSYCWQPEADPPPNLRDLPRRMKLHWGAPPPAVQARDEASICQTTHSPKTQPKAWFIVAVVFPAWGCVHQK